VVPERATPKPGMACGFHGSRIRSNCYRMDAIMLTFTALMCGCVSMSSQNPPPLWW
jgi:hypothetical protein